MTIQSKVIDLQAANKLAMEQRGEAIADLLIAEVKEQSGTLKRFLQDVYGLDQAGRKAFRVQVQHHLKQIRAHVVAKKGTPEGDVYATTARSAGVRLSEATVFSRAVDAGYSPDFTTGTYHSCVAQARAYLDSDAANGPTARRGRKASPFIDKVKALTLKQTPSAADMALAAELLIEMSKNMANAEAK